VEQLGISTPVAVITMMLKPGTTRIVTDGGDDRDVIAAWDCNRR